MEAKTAPSVVSSWLEDKKVYYASLVRYNEAFGRGREVIIATTHEDLETAFRNLAERFLVILGKGPTTAIDELSELCFGKKNDA